MKRILAAVSFAVLAVHAFADDRGAPFEQPQFDRGVPVQTIPHGRAAGGATSTATGASNVATGVWANDYNFIAPAQ